MCQWKGWISYEGVLTMNTKDLAEKLIACDEAALQQLLAWLVAQGMEVGTNAGENNEQCVSDGWGCGCLVS